MKINNEVIDRLKDFDIPVSDGLSYLLSIYFDCVSSTTSRVLVKQVHLTKILMLDDQKKLKWQIPLFESQSSDEKWDWVIDEYREMFKNVNPKRTGPKNSSISRMKRFFSENPDVRKEEIIGATKMYIRNLTDANYITSAHYFINKGTGSNRISGLEDWVDKYKSYQMTQTKDTDDVTQTMQ